VSGTNGHRIPDELKEQLAKDNNALREKHSESDDWKLTNKKEQD
jgi:hypothetical protein